MSLRRALASVVLAVALPSAGTARASSLVFVKRADGNVWLAAADGTAAVPGERLNGTPADPYYSPTQSDVRHDRAAARGAGSCRRASIGSIGSARG